MKVKLSNTDDDDVIEALIVLRLRDDENDVETV